MPNQQTAAEIVEAVREARRALGELDQQLQSEIDTIDFADFSAPGGMSAEDRVRRTELRASQTEARDAYNALVLFSLMRLNHSNEVRDLHHRMTALVQSLGDDLERLKTVERYAATATKVADALAKAASKLARLIV